MERHSGPQQLLEAMAMQKTVLASPQALAGLSARPGIELLAASGPADTAKQVRAARHAGGA